MSKSLDEMTLSELESLSYSLTAQRQALKQRAVDVQVMIGRRVDEERVSKLLGRDVQFVASKSIESEEAVVNV